MFNCITAAMREIVPAPNELIGFTWSEGIGLLMPPPAFKKILSAFWPCALPFQWKPFGAATPLPGLKMPTSMPPGKTVSQFVAKFTEDGPLFDAQRPSV